MKTGSKAAMVAGACALLAFPGARAADWTLAGAAAPYKGETVTVVGLDRPSYQAAAKLTPQFEQETGIHVKWVNFPYESTLKAETLNFVSQSHEFDAILTDVVWPVNFGRAHWVVPIKTFLDDKSLADPAIDMDDFFPIWLKAFTVHGTSYGLPFDSYSGLLYYNKKILAEHGFSGPPTSWDQLANQYAPKLFDPSKNLYPYAVQSARGETQTADSFARFLWPWGGHWFDVASKKLAIDEPGAVAGLTFRQNLLKYMPNGIIADDHTQVVQLMSQGQVAMITEWSAFYPTLKASPMGADLGVTVEPAGPKGRYAAFGGFAYMVSAQIPKKQQAATWLFIQWLTSKAMGKPLVDAGAVIARKSIDTDPAVMQGHPYLEPMTQTWTSGTVPDHRPQIACYPYFSELVSDYGSDIEGGKYPVDAGLKLLASKLEGYMNSTKCWSSVNNATP